MNSRVQIVIPARLASTRLPQKLLRRAGGKSILQHTFEAASRSSAADAVIVAVDHKRLAEEVESFGGRWIMTSPQCASGTDRIAEVAAAMPEVDLLINVQGDEPEIDPGTIDRVAAALVADPQAEMATAAAPIRSKQPLNDPSCVKIVIADPSGAGQGGQAIYFSRSSVPHVRDGVTSDQLNAEPPMFWHHIGLYAYRRDFLTWFASQPASRLETVEKLEQLRAIEAGKRIVVARVASAPLGIDTEDDFQSFQARLTT